MSSVKSKANEYFTTFNKELSKQPYLVQLEDQSGCHKSLVVLGTFLVFFILTFFNYGAQLITNFLAWSYPAYASLKTIELSSSNDDTQWLTYWIIIAFLQMLEYFSKFILYWLPFYYTFKVIFILWLILPQFKGTQVVYKQVLRPYLVTKK